MKNIRLYIYCVHFTNSSTHDSTHFAMKKLATDIKIFLKFNYNDIIIISYKQENGKYQT